MPSEISRLDLELLALGQLPAERAAQLRELAEADDDLAERIASVERGIQGAMDLPELMLPDMSPAEPARRRWWLLVPVPLLALVAALLLFVRPPPEVTWRGDLDLQIWRVHMGQAVEQGAVIDAQAGDRLQWTIETNEAGWFAVYDVQEDGEVNVFTEPMELSAHSLIEGAVLLDDYAGSERLFFVLTDQPLRVVDVEIAVEEAWRSPIQDVDALPLDALTQRSVLVLK